MSNFYAQLNTYYADIIYFIINIKRGLPLSA
jgi:hypothetical protein